MIGANKCMIEAGAQKVHDRCSVHVNAGKVLSKCMAGANMCMKQANTCR
jgi:hypothetical protein